MRAADLSPRRRSCLKTARPRRDGLAGLQFLLLSLALLGCGSAVKLLMGGGTEKLTNARTLCSDFWFFTEVNAGFLDEETAQHRAPIGTDAQWPI